MRVDADDFARPCGDGKMHHEIKEIRIEPGAVNALEEAMSDGFLKEYISPLLICDTNTCKATEELMEDIFDRCQVLVLDAEELQADQHAIEIVENYMDDDIDLILAVGAGTVHVASMTWNGQARRIQAEAPIAVYADTDIFANAPAELNMTGLSRLNDNDIYPTEIRISETQIAQGEEDACEKLMYALIQAGLAGQSEGD